MKEELNDKAGMNKVEKLIAQLCPDGIEYRELGKIAEIANTGVDKKIIDNQQPVMLLNYMDVYRNKHITEEVISMQVTASDKKLIECDIQQGDIFITPTSETKDDIGHAAVADADIPNAVYSYHIMRFRLFEKNLTTSYFLSYLFEGDIIQKQIDKSAVGLTRFGVTKNKFAKFKIPIPPLAVQQEIVNILDKFTELEAEAELEAELEARRTQYEFYRDKLLSFSNITEGVTNCESGSYVEWKTLGEIGFFYGGLTGKTKADFTEGDARFISYMNIFRNIAVDTKKLDFVRIKENEKQNKVEYGDVLFTGSSETPDECGMSSVLTTIIDKPLYLNSFCFGFRLYCKELLTPDFLKHLFRANSIRKQIGQTASGVTRFNVSKSRFSKITIPIPPLAEQERIVAILDKFDALVNDISVGLPAEIAARRKQYEYYRGRLLDFKNVNNG